MVEKIKTDVDKQLLVRKMKKSLILQNLSTFFLLSKLKAVYQRLILSSLPFLKF